MRFPVVRDRVRLRGRSGTFLVLSVDRTRAVADVISTSKGGRVEENVPIASILPLVQEGPQDDRELDGDSRGKA